MVVTARYEYRVVVLDDDGRVESNWGNFPSDDEFVRRILGYARNRHGDKAALQRREQPPIPQWETVA
jgi:Arc/MetJ-type ribon-helix-helix transcriptional regulator